MAGIFWLPKTEIATRKSELRAQNSELGNPSVQRREWGTWRDVIALQPCSQDHRENFGIMDFSFLFFFTFLNLLWGWLGPCGFRPFDFYSKLKIENQNLTIEISIVWFLKNWKSHIYNLNCQFFILRKVKLKSNFQCFENQKLKMASCRLSFLVSREKEN